MTERNHESQYGIYHGIQRGARAPLHPQLCQRKASIRCGALSYSQDWCARAGTFQSGLSEPTVGGSDIASAEYKATYVDEDIVVIMHVRP